MQYKTPDGRVNEVTSRKRTLCFKDIQGNGKENRKFAVKKKNIMFYVYSLMTV